MLRLIYITNSPEVARIAEAAGVDAVMVDLEALGKAERQRGMDTVQSRHTVADVAAVRAALTSAELVARCNPVHDALPGWASTEDELDALVAAGADTVMLPYFQGAPEAARFLAALAGRARSCLLFETPAAVAAAPGVLALGPDEAYVGLNDLSLALGQRFMFQPLADGTVERLAHQFLAAGVPFGFGGVAAVDGGLLPGARVIREHYRLGSTSVILSRSFCDAGRAASLAEVERTFREGVAAIRACEAECARAQAFFSDNAAEVRGAVAAIAGGGGRAA